ncbi:MAG: MATE family efflux transporter [Treponema sp.]|jgi:putative MATE family efflux protein|nr:MATE family efflux transporter [Treponema sp.]
MSDDDIAVNAAMTKHEMMTTSPVEPLICKLAVPTIITMLVSSIYNMADTYFVSSLGTSAIAGVGVVFSLMSIIQAAGFFFGHGTGNFISRSLGAKKTEEAEKMAATGFYTAFAAGLVITLFGTIFIRPLALLLGSTVTILPYAVDYLRFILLGAPFMVSSFMMNNLLRYQGSALFGMMGMTTGALLNIILDPVFIFILKMGVKGASLATMISQCVSFFILYFMACRMKGNLRIEFRSFSPSRKYYREIVRGGTPSLLRQSMQSLTTLLLNHAAGLHGDAVIAAISITHRVFMFANSAILGFGQAFQPVCGFNFGAKRYDRVKKAFWFCLRLCTSMLIILAAACFIFAPSIIALFRHDDADVLRVGTFMIRAHSISLPFLGWILLTSFMLQTIGKAIPASILAFARQGLFYIPLLFTIVPVFGVLGIQLCTPIADTCSFILSLFLGIRVLRKDLSVTL